MFQVGSQPNQSQTNPGETEAVHHSETKRGWRIGEADSNFPTRFLLMEYFRNLLMKKTTLVGRQFSN